MEENKEMYQRVAEAFADRVESLFASEDSLKARWAEWSVTRELDRTSDWNFILKWDLESAWAKVGPVVKVSLTQVDIDEILSHLDRYLDYNLFTQVYLNLQSLAPLRYSTEMAKKAAADIDTRWEGKEHPGLAKKAFKNPENIEQNLFNTDYGILKSIKWVQEHGGYLNPSFRVSPKGATPAFADSINLSNQSIFSDRFIQPLPGWSLYHLTWTQAPGVLSPGAKPGEFVSPSFAYPFTSSSGGTMLNDVLFSRLMMRHVLAFTCDMSAKITSVVVPRLTSLLVLSQATTSVFEANTQTIIDTLPQSVEMKLHIGARKF